MGSKIPIEMDGPAFHHANAALNQIKKSRQCFLCRTENANIDLVVNTVLSLMWAIKSKWNEITFNRYWKYKELGTLEKVAQLESVSAQAIWDSMHNMKVMEVLEAEKNLIQYFKQIQSIEDKSAHELHI
jgi:hypothetical protein